MRQIGKTRRRWEANAEWILNEVRCERIDWTIVAQVTVQGPVSVYKLKELQISLEASYFGLLFQ